MNKIVRATAGAGKTTGLLDAVYQTYLRSFNESGLNPKILLSTFTVKAANELTERLTKKAIEEKDVNFLNFVSSSYLEVGTLHSVFLKIFEKIKNNGLDSKKKFNSKSYRQQVGRGVLHKVLKSFQLEDFLKEAREEQDLLDLYWHMYSYAFKDLSIFTISDLESFVWSHLTVLAKEIDDVDLIKVLQTHNFDLDFVLKWVQNKIAEDSKNKKKYKKIDEFAADPINQKKFISEVVKRNEHSLKIYREWKMQVDDLFQEKSLFDISDVEISLLEVLRKEEFKDKIWDFCFFDEHQDTSPIQKDILDILSAQSVNYFVGDPFQSIYYFRGARKEIFLKDFTNIESGVGETEYRLNNYRSSKVIVDFANGLTKFLLPDFIEMEAFHKDREGSVKVVHFENGDENHEFSYVADQLQSVDLESESVAVLSRGAKDLLKLARYLKSKGFSYRLALSKGFESSLETIELSNLLKFQHKPDDDESFLPLLFSYWSEVDHEVIRKAVDEGKEKDCSLWSLLKDHRGLQHFANFLEKSKTMNLSYSLSDFVGESGFLDFSEDLDPSGDREKNIIKFLGALGDEEVKEGFNLLSFCNDILKGLYKFESEDFGSDKGCTLMTVHGSKGLQFDHVFLIGTNKSRSGNLKPFYFDLEDNVFSLKILEEKAGKFKHPYLVDQKLSEEKKEIYEEKKRLLYVAMTRAQKALHIIGSKKVSRTAKEMSWMSSALDFIELKGLKEQVLVEETKEFIAVENDSDIHKISGGFLKSISKFSFSDVEFLGVTQNLHDQEINKGVKRDLGFFSEAISQGVVFHELLEKANSFEHAQELVDHFFKSDGVVHKKAIAYLFSDSEIPFQEIFDKGFREWGFDTFGEKRRSGKIDLWAKIENTVWIVDYKTGSTANLEKGFEQISAYKEVIRDFLLDPDLEFKLVLSFPYKEKTFIRS